MSKEIQFTLKIDSPHLDPEELAKAGLNPLEKPRSITPRPSIARIGTISN